MTPLLIAAQRKTGMLQIGCPDASAQAAITRRSQSLHCTPAELEIVKETHLCCDFVKHCRVSFPCKPDAEEVTMPAIAEVLPTKSPHPAPRGSELPACPVCADSMIAAEASAFVADNLVSYLWTCDTCGYGFVTKHSFKAVACN